MSERLRAHVARFRRACEEDTRVTAAYVGGSLAKGTADRYSDIDVYVVTAPEDYESLWTDRHAFMSRWGEHVSLIDVIDFEGIGFDMVLFTMDDGTEGEVAFGHRDNFMSLHGGPHEVLLDREGLLDGVEFPLFVSGAEQRRAEVAQVLARFWREVTHFAKAWARGSLAGAMAILGRMRRSCAALTAGDMGPLAFSYVTFERDALAEAATELVAFFEQHAPALAGELDLEYPHGHARVARQVFDDWMKT